MTPRSRFRAPRIAIALAALAALPLAACSKGAKSGEDPDAAVAPTASGSAPAPSSSAASSSTANASPAAKGLQVVLKDLQLFHPYSPDRAMPTVRDDGVDTTHSRFRYGLGLVVEATNESGEMLHDATFEGVVKFTGPGSETTCHITADAIGSRDYGPRFLAFAQKAAPDVGSSDNAKLTWFDESGSVSEAPWRPSERIRLSTRDDCELPTVDDLGVTSVHGQLTVRARRTFVEAWDKDFDDTNFDLWLNGESVTIYDRRSARVVVVPLREVARQGDAPVATVAEMVAALVPGDGQRVKLKRLKLFRSVRYSDADLVESAPVEIDINPRALTLQLVKLPTGEMAHASGNVVIHLGKEGKVAWDDMAKLKMSLVGVERADVPATMPEVAFDADELSARVTNVALVHYTDDPSLAKGQRRVAVTWKLALKGEAIEARLKAAVDEATAAADQAERDSVPIELGSDKAAIAKSKADVAKAKAAKTAAETKFKSSLSSERGRLVKLLSCGDIRLVTNLKARGALNGKAASDACKGLDHDNEVEVTLAYSVDRYELPVALAYSLGKDPRFSPIASAPLLKLDPR